MVEIVDEPKEQTYYKLLDYLSERCGKFSLMIHDKLRKYDSVYNVLELLDGFLLEEVRAEDFPYVDYYEGTVKVYRLTKESLGILKSQSRSLYQWQHPELPEDLSFFDDEWNMKLYNIAHEAIGVIYVNDDNEVRKLIDDIGLLVRLNDGTGVIDSDNRA